MRHVVIALSCACLAISFAACSSSGSTEANPADSSTGTPGLDDDSSTGGGTIGSWGEPDTTNGGGNDGPDAGTGGTGGTGTDTSGGGGGGDCFPRSCVAEGLDCGAIEDGCGGALFCGTCSEGQECGAGGKPNVCDDIGECEPTSCFKAEKDCGAIDDGCGKALYCGDCEEGMECGGGGEPNVCAPPGSCEATTCEWEGKDCGAILDGCGAALYCGVCEGDEVCVENVCTCTPTTCELAEANCGVIEDGCGELLTCGECADNETCSDANQCECIQNSCDDANVECGPVPDGCGGTVFCGHCAGNGVCLGNTCLCQPQCDGKVCGDDGCGGTCGECEAGSGCIEGQCVGATQCGGNCGEGYNCNNQGCQCWCDTQCWEYGDCCEDICLACEQENLEQCCTPDCTDKNCGSDGCGGSCGECLPGSDCEAGVCSACVPECAGKDCGSDGCGGNCGTCSGGQLCDDGLCSSCVPDCSGKECGDNGCGGNCGHCDDQEWCDDGSCEPAYCDGECGDGYQCNNQGCQCWCDWQCFQYGDCCPDVCSTCGEDFPDNCCTPQCDGKQCGGDGCGGSCGSCGVGEDCENGQCSVCVPNCSGKDCGGDGCGGSCGSCAAEDKCEAGICVGCQPQCDGKECGSNGCSGTCGTCDAGDTCTVSGQCVACVPQCQGKLCGDDGCGGSCGDCGIDCNNLPSGPFALNKLSGPMASEDLAFDDAGNVIGSNDNAIFKSQYNSNPAIWVPNFNFRAGLRYLPTGDLLVNKDSTGQLVLIEPDGTASVVLNNLAYPNGLTADFDANGYVTEHDAKRIIRVDPYTGQVDTLSQGVVSNPNGIAFNPDYSMLYVGGFSGAGIIYAFPVDANGDIGEIFQWATNVGSGWLDGIGVDICGNVYIADYGTTRILRLPSTGDDYDIVMQGSGGQYLPNMQWGSGIGGWDPLKVYLPDGWNKGVFEVEMGVPGAPVPSPFNPTAPWE